MMRAGRLVRCTSLAAAFVTVTGFGVAVYTFTRYVLGAPMSFEYVSGLWFLASMLVVTLSVALLVSAESSTKQKVHSGMFVWVLFSLWGLFFVGFDALLVYPLARFLFFLAAFNSAVALLLYRLQTHPN